MQNTPRTPKIVALYARVSTKDRQEAENQLRGLREYCRKQDWQIANEYVDHDSGSKSEREQFKQLFTHAHQKRFDTVVFWALDRFSREGTRETLIYSALPLQKSAQRLLLQFQTWWENSGLNLMPR